jgi:hypothetical protein
VKLLVSAGNEKGFKFVAYLVSDLYSEVQLLEISETDEFDVNLVLEIALVLWRLNEFLQRRRH